MTATKTMTKLFQVLLLSSIIAQTSYAKRGVAAVDSDMSTDVQSEVESLKANLDDAEGGLATSRKELSQAKNDLVLKTNENIETVARLKKQIKKLNEQQVSNTAETAKLTASIVKLDNEIKKIEAIDNATKVKSEIITNKLLDVRATHDQTSMNSQKLNSDLKSSQTLLRKNELALKQRQNYLKIALNKEKALQLSLKKAELSLQKQKVIATAEDKKIDQQLKDIAAKTALLEKKIKLAVEKQAAIQERIKQKRQRLSDAKEKQKKAAVRLGSN